jgi:Mitochondrial 18 KDa protein (MTP18)
VNLLAAERAMDTVVWQMLASVAIPGYTIHTIVAIAHSLLAQVLLLLCRTYIAISSHVT